MFKHTIIGVSSPSMMPPLYASVHNPSTEPRTLVGKSSMVNVTMPVKQADARSLPPKKNPTLTHVTAENKILNL